MHNSEPNLIKTEYLPAKGETEAANHDFALCGAGSER